MKIPRLTVHCWVASLLAAALSIAGCSGEGTADTAGSLAVNIDLEGADDQRIDEVTWRIVGPGFDESGPINTSQPGTSDDDVHRQTGFFEKFGLLPCEPPGDECYTVYLTAWSTDQDTECEGSATFTIVADQRTDVYVRINCNTVERLGAVRVDGEFNRCGVIDQVVTSPLQVAIGGIIDGAVFYSDAEGDPMNVQWTAVGGSVNFVNGDVTEYTCEEITSPNVDPDDPATWTNSITVEVSDDNFIYCVDSWTVRVTCVAAPACGNDVIDPGEDCDPPDGVFCDADCQQIIEVPDPVTQTVGIVASNNVTGDISALPYELSVTALGPVVDGVPVDFAVTGTAFFPPSFLNAAISTIPGLTEVTLNALTATPSVRSGAAVNGDLTTLTSADPLPAQVPIPILGLPASIPICGSLNVATCPNSCTDGTACNQPGPDVCAGIGDNTCAPRGACICVVEPLVLPLSSDVVTVTPDISATGDILFGWNEDLLPPQTVIVTNPPGPNGIRVLAIVLQVGIEGWMGECEAPFTECEGNADVAVPLSDAQLLAIPISP